MSQKVLREKIRIITGQIVKRKIPTVKITVRILGNESGSRILKKGYKNKRLP